MTVAELIERLRLMPPDLPVAVPGRCDDLVTVGRVEGLVTVDDGDGHYGWDDRGRSPTLPRVEVVRLLGDE